MTYLRHKRIFAFLIDIAILIIVGMILQCVTYIISNVILFSMLLSLWVTIFLNKDIVGGQSIGKYIMQIRIVSSNGLPIHMWKLVVRNIFNVLWIIELILWAVTNRRLADDILGLDVEATTGTSKYAINIVQIVCIVFFSWLILFCFCMLLMNAAPLLKLLYVL